MIAPAAAATVVERALVSWAIELASPDASDKAEAALAISSTTSNEPLLKSSRMDAKPDSFSSIDAVAALMRFADDRYSPTSPVSTIRR